MSDERAGWGIAEWLAQTPLSRRMLYDLWKRGAGPQRVTVGGRAVITEAPAAYFARQQPQPRVNWRE